ncbi:hypothetical protein [Actinocorallia libanotica]|uniref:Tail assembly chaperone n=1 Tax=Actinocorallia libanotica TaxID=46162 RepID=A0ABP4CE64_9ACTN
MDDYGEGLYPDLLFHYGIDLREVVAGRGPAPSLVLLLAQRLPDTSLTVALMAGGRRYFGWGVDRHMLADLYDALNLLTRAAGQWGKKGPPDIPLYPRPKAKTKKAEKAKGSTRTSVADLYKRFTRR